MKNAVSLVSPPDVSAILPDHDFVDCYEIAAAPQGELLATARSIMGTAPKWVTTLLALRNALVKPFGLKGEPQSAQNANYIGMFPIISSTADRVVLGMDDKHLDFRLVLDRLPQTGNLRLATAVRCRNIFGRVYLAIVMPFHRVIVPVMLRGALKKG
jgi:Protein of unknown function (DUF2867)